MPPIQYWRLFFFFWYRSFAVILFSVFLFRSDFEDLGWFFLISFVAAEKPPFQNLADSIGMAHEKWRGLLFKARQFLIRHHYRKIPFESVTCSKKGTAYFAWDYLSDTHTKSGIGLSLCALAVVQKDIPWSYH